MDRLPKFAWTKKADSPIGASSEDIPEDLWTRCTGCKELLYTREVEKNYRVCHKCGEHFRMSARERIPLVADEGSFEELDSLLISADPLKFTSLTEPDYLDKSAQTREKTGLNEAIITGFTCLDGMPLGVAISDFSFQGGSMGSVVGEKIVRLIEEALHRNTPVLTISASGGARMHEGMFSLMQMAKTTAALAKLGEAHLAHFSLLTDPCTGGVIASYASVADVVLAEPGALIGFAGPRVIEQITKQKLPPGFQTAEFLLEHGMIDLVLPRKELRTTLVNLLGFYAQANRQARQYHAQPQPQVSYAG